MKGKASDICPKCKHCEGSVDIVEKSYYVCGDSHSDGGLYHLIPTEDELYCTAYEEEANMNKVEGKVSDWCPKCKNCKDITRESNGVHVWLTEVECEDPYDGMTKTLDADSDICCSMFEPKPDKSCENDIYVTSYMGLYEEKKEKEPCDKISYLQHELEMDKLRMKIHQLEKEKDAHLKGIERLKNKNEKYLKKIVNQQARDYKQCARIMDLEFAVNKLQSGEYDDILAKDIEIKSLQAKYEDAMSGWNHTMESHDKSIQTIEELKAEIDNLKNENISLNTINKGLAEDRKKLINYIRSLKIASENYLKEFTYEED